MASLQLSSRFELLNVQDADHDSKRQHRSSKSNDKKQESLNNENAKKRAKKKKRQQQLNSERDELRGMAFMHKTGSGGHGGDAVQPSKSSKHKNTSGSSEDTSHPQSQPSENWKNKDEELLDKRYEDDLEKALLESRIMFEEKQTFLKAVGNLPPENESEVEKEVKKEEKLGGKKEKKNQKKEKNHPMSLQEFHSTAPSSQGVGLDDIEPVEEESSPSQTQVESPQKEDTFFKDIEQEATGILRQEHLKSKKKPENKTQQKGEDKREDVRRLQYEDELQKKDDEIKQLKEDFSKQKDELAQVKKRNKQLCFILAQGEMKDKADVLKQVEELTAVRDELTQQVKDLHTALEQERSKVSSLKTELQKLQEKKK